MVTGVRNFRGEAWVRTARTRGRRSAYFDLSFDVMWRASVDHGKVCYSGTVRLDDLCSANEPDSAYEVDLSFDTQPLEDTDEEIALLNLIGPLAPRPARMVEGKLGRMLWERVMLFRQKFEEFTAQ